MGKLQKQQNLSKHQEPIKVKTIDKFSKKSVEVKSKINLKHDDNLIKKLNKNFIKNNEKEQMYNVTNGIINESGKSKKTKVKKQKNSSPVKVHLTNPNAENPSQKFTKNKKSGDVSSLKVAKAETIKLKKPKTVAPTPETKKLNKKPKTVLAPTPELKKPTKDLSSAPDLKKPKTVQAPTPDSKKPKTVQAPTPALKKPKTVQTPRPQKKKSQKNKEGVPVVAISEQKKDEQNKVHSNKKVAKKINTTNKNKSTIDSNNSDEAMPLADIPKFDEKSFNDIVKLENVEKAVGALNKIVKEESNKMKNCIFSDYRYVLNVTCFKVPNCPKRTVKLRLKHKLVSDDDDVALIVKDLKRGAKIDYEPTIHHWEDLLRKNGIGGIKAIIPFNQLKKEYTTYEMKIKFSNQYEYYLCDAAISGHVVGFLGKSCSKKLRSTVFAVRTMNLNNLKNEIRKSLSKTSYHQGQKGNMISIPIGTDKMTSTQVAENLLQVVDELRKVYVGGLANIRNMHLRINLKGTSAVPIYISLAEAPILTPFSIGPREKRLAKLKDRANQILEKFELTKSGELLKLPHDQVLLKRATARTESKDDKIGTKRQKIDKSIEKSSAEQSKGLKILESNFKKKNKADINTKSTELQESNTGEEEMDNLQHKEDEISELDSVINEDVFSDYEEEDESSDASDETESEREGEGTNEEDDGVNSDDGNDDDGEEDEGDEEEEEDDEDEDEDEESD